MRGFATLSLILLGLLGWMTLSCINAKADTGTEQQFLDAAHNAGYDFGDDQLLRDAHLVCALHQQGTDNELINRGIQAAQRFLGHNADATTDANFILLAETNLCPEVTG